MAVWGGAGGGFGALSVDVGPDQTLHLPISQIVLTAVASGNGSTGATFAWIQTSGATAVLLAGAATNTLTASGLVLGAYGFRVTASDGAGGTATDDILVTVASDATECPGATYYVSTTGNDAAAGTSGAPWQTIVKAANTVPAGSTIHVAAGTYTETQQIALPVGVCLEGDGATTIIKSTLTADWTALLRAASNEGTDGHQHISNLKFDGQNLSTFWGIEVAGRSNVSIHDVTVVDFKDRGVLMTGRDDNQEGAPTQFATGLTFYNNTVLNSAAYDTPNGVYGRGCLNVGGTQGMLIYNNVITQNQRPEGFNGWPIKYLNGGFNRGLKIFENQLTKIPFTGDPGSNGWDFAVEMFFDQGTEFFNNVVSGAGFDTNTQEKGRTHTACGSTTTSSAFRTS